MKLGSYLKGKRILITGGTGSFGHQIVTRLVEFDPDKIIIFSRDEEKQYRMQNELEDNKDLLEFVIGDVRNFDRICEAMKGVNIVYHAAALKQVPNCEYHPFEAVQTNVIGAENVRRSAIENSVDVVVSISTDKAVKPVNTMGMTKALQERIMLCKSSERVATRFVCVRYGNVIGSRGSVIPYFKQRILDGKFLPITDKNMTRFLITLPEAIDLVFKATMKAETMQLFVKKMPACKLLDLARVMGKSLSGRDDYPVRIVGIRPGEKIHEVLVSEEEMRRVVESRTHYVIYPYGKLNKAQLISNLREYTSDVTHLLDENELGELLRQERWL
jgi:FlaA1/EpsC-like NDP-sugar epimerase